MRTILCSATEVMSYMENFLLVLYVSVGRSFGKTMRGDRNQRGDGHNTYRCGAEKLTRMYIRGLRYFQKGIFVLQVVGLLQQVFV